MMAHWSSRNIPQICMSILALIIELYSVNMTFWYGVINIPHYWKTVIIKPLFIILIILKEKWIKSKSRNHANPSFRHLTAMTALWALGPSKRTFFTLAFWRRIEGLWAPRRSAGKIDPKLDSWESLTVCLASLVVETRYNAAVTIRNFLRRWAILKSLSRTSKKMLEKNISKSSIAAASHAYPSSQPNLLLRKKMTHNRPKDSPPAPITRPSNPSKI